MDPVTLTIIATLFALATGGATTAAVRKRRRSIRQKELRESLQARRPIGEQRISIFDVFWDLGASEYALELLAHHDLLPEDGDDQAIFGAWSRLEDLVEQHGNYAGFLSDSLDAIQEFFDEHRHAGHRRRLPELTAVARRVIPVPRRLTTDAEPTDMPDAPGGGEHTPSAEPPRPSASSLEERRKLRDGGGHLGLRADAGHEAIDLDALGDVQPLDVLQSIVDGGLGDQLEKWWKTRKLRQLRKELDEDLAALYKFYADIARRDPDFYEPIYDAHHRWRDEATRLRFVARRRRWAGLSHQWAADVLFELAIDLAERLARRAYQSTYGTIETIHDYARREDQAMAGYLIYLNRHPFFAGRYPGYGDLARDVEYATHRVQKELIRLRDEGVV